MSAISEQLVEVALTKIKGYQFESFCNSFYSAVEGGSFTPLGGVHDGGADGFSENIYESSKPMVFYQFSSQEKHRSKIKQTIQRLKSFGREPKALIYVTSINIPNIDNEELDLSEELNVNIKIRDSKYIISHINDNTGTQAAYTNHLSSHTAYLKQVGASRTIPKSQHAIDPSVYVFLQQEVENRFGKTNLLETITDTLIIWALNETDPDKGIFLSREEVLDKILATIPWSKQFIKAHLDRRLGLLRSKNGVDGREITLHGASKKYCLPYKTRQVIQNENLEDESLRIEVLAEFEKHLVDNHLCESDDAQEISELAIKTIEHFFEKEGLTFSYFLKDDQKQDPPNTIDDRIDEVIVLAGVKQEKSIVFKNGIRQVLLKAFYNSTERQRSFLYHLSRTYVLLFSLQAEPRILEYFQGMTANFRLYVGSDIIIKALTERYLNPEDQMARNMLRLATDIGVQLFLSEPILEEIYTHIEATNYEFRNHFAAIEPYITRELASQSGKVLIRTYFYAKEAGKVSGWKTFINQFVTYSKLGAVREDARAELKNYLLTEFSMEYLSKSDLEGYVNLDKVNELSGKLFEYKTKEELAYNDALMVHAVYGLRRRNREMSKVVEYGFSTWWLTHEAKVQRHTAEIVKSEGARYIMRPEFLLNFFALAPQRVEVLQSYKSIFPSVVGLQMGHRINEDIFHRVLSKVAEWKEFEPSRINVLVGDLSDKLKTDRLKVYEQDLDFDKLMS